IHALIDQGSYYFLSRPRRFGKSLLVNTIKDLFEGVRENFEGCWVYDQWNWDEKYTVIKISFSEVSYRARGLEKALEIYLAQLAERHGVRFETTSYSEQFLELIRKLGEKKPVVTLIDEYDKPIIDYLEESEMDRARENREILKTFYSGVKDQDQYIRFFFITGVSKFSRVSIFSDLNHLTDISVTKRFSNIVGYSEEEIEKHYKPYLEALAHEFETTEKEIMGKIRRWYNGYSWDGKTFLLNPYSVISLLFGKEFKNYWFETGSPTFLIKKLKESGGKINASINKFVKESVFNKFDIENLNTTAIMFQTGYLTIKAYDKNESRYLLDFPNKEVRDSFLEYAVENYANSSSESMEYIVDSLIESLHQNDMESFFTGLKSLFSSITVKQLEKVKEYEGFYHSIIYIVLKIIGIRIQCEIQSSFGATDAVVQTDEYIYIFEFKMGTAQSAIDQIKKKKYCAPHLSDKREVVIVGFSFDKAERNLVEMLTETVKPESR
ncbi:MAG: AAA family ATPase, partial [Proteobacteria bacterium]|nr:AAA family ATPase [Pseudomonadota bacterium]